MLRQYRLGTDRRELAGMLNARHRPIKRADFGQKSIGVLVARCVEFKDEIGGMSGQDRTQPEDNIFLGAFRVDFQEVDSSVFALDRIRSPKRHSRYRGDLRVRREILSYNRRV